VVLDAPEAAGATSGSSCATVVRRGGVGGETMTATYRALARLSRCQSGSVCVRDAVLLLIFRPAHKTTLRPRSNMSCPACSHLPPTMPCLALRPLSFIRGPTQNHYATPPVWRRSVPRAIWNSHAFPPPSASNTAVQISHAFPPACPLNPQLSKRIIYARGLARDHPRSIFLA